MKGLVLPLLFLAALLRAPASAEAMDTIHYSTGMKYMNDREYENAVEEFRKMLILYPDHAPSYHRIGACWRALGKNALAVYNLRKAAKYSPDDPEIRRELAEACRADSEAVAAAAGGDDDDAVAEEPKAPPPAARAALPAAEKAAPPAAEPQPAGDALALSGGERHNETSSDPLMKPVLDAYNAGQCGKALSAVRDLLKKKPGHAGAYYYGGVIRYANNELDKAAVNFRQAFTYPDKGHNAHFYLGLINEKEGRIAEAIKEYEEYVSLTAYEAGKQEAKGRISRLLAGLGGRAAAAQAPAAGGALAGGPGAPPDPGAFPDTGSSAGDTSGGPEDPRYAAVNVRLGDAAFARRDLKGALKHFLKALGAETDAVRKVALQYRAGECYFRQGSDRGVEYFLQAASADTAIRSEAVRESCLRLGDYYCRLKNGGAALKYYLMAAERFPSSPSTAWALYQIGNLHKGAGRTEEAIRAYERLLRDFAGDYWAARARWQKEDAVWESEYRDILQ